MSIVLAVDMLSKAANVRRPSTAEADLSGSMRRLKKGVDAPSGERKVRRPRREAVLIDDGIVLYKQWFLFELWAHLVFPLSEDSGVNGSF